MRAFFIADPIQLGVPERPGFDPHNFETRLCQALNQDASGRAHSDYAVIDFVVIAVSVRLFWNALQRAEMADVFWWLLEFAEHR